MSHPVIKWQILAKDPVKSEAFYTSLFDWKVNADNPLGYRMIDTGSDRGINGGIWPAPEAPHSSVQLFVAVDDVDKYPWLTPGMVRVTVIVEPTRIASNQ